MTLFQSLLTIKNLNRKSQGNLNTTTIRIFKMNVVKDTYLNDYRRRLKSVSQRFLLVGLLLVDTNTIKCKILGSSNRIYTLELVTTENQVHARCDCPDCVIRKVTCKHMYWFGTKQLGVSDPNFWTVETVDIFIKHNKKFQEQINRERNEICPICFELIDYQNQHTIRCTMVCQNSVHLLCWRRYNYVSFSNQCVICRSRSMPSIL